eukprot:6636967-Pyramimonas_sp.AAC.1
MSSTFSCQSFVGCLESSAKTPCARRYSRTFQGPRPMHGGSSGSASSVAGSESGGPPPPPPPEEG